jgi:hypothetical protein
VLRRLAQLRSERASDERYVRRVYGGPVGLADRIEALDVTGRIYPAIGFFSSVLTIMLIVLDASPAAGKTMLLLGEKTAYERELEAEEAEIHTLGEIDRAAVREAARITGQETVDQAEIHREQWRETLDPLVAQVVEIQRRTVEQAIRTWERQITEQLNGSRGPLPPGDAPAPRPAQEIVSFGEPRGTRPRLALTPLRAWFQRRWRVIP